MQGLEVEAERLRKLSQAGEPLQKCAGYAETGLGRLTRQIRKLQHELSKERERAEGFAEMIMEAGICLPEQMPYELTAMTESAKKEICPCEEREGSSLCRNRCGEGEDFCRECPLEGLRVAVIGGPGRMQPAYRQVVQQLGAEFLFHDGEVKNGSYRLKSMVCGADIVVFITSVNSHGALNAVKAVCRKNGKKFIALRETGAESLGKTLRVTAA